MDQWTLSQLVLLLVTIIVIYMHHVVRLSTILFPLWLCFFLCPCVGWTSVQYHLRSPSLAGLRCPSDALVSSCVSASLRSVMLKVYVRSLLWANCHWTYVYSIAFMIFWDIPQWRNIIHKNSPWKLSNAFSKSSESNVDRIVPCCTLLQDLPNVKMWATLDFPFSGWYYWKSTWQGDTPPIITVPEITLL